MHVYSRRTKKKCSKTSACVKFFSNKDGKYILCQYGRSPSKKWIGLTKLNYFITGDYKSESKEELLNNIYNCLNVSMNYDKLNIEKCILKDDILSKFISKAKKEKYDGFSVISIDLKVEDDHIEVVEWERVGKTGNEWRVNSDNFISISYNDFNIKVEDAIYKLIISAI